jgi:RNA polymerase sigma-70 factor (ECF subfamily)
MQNACCDCLRRKNKSHAITHLPLEKVLNSAKEIPTEETTHNKQKDEFLRINRLLATLPQEQSETLRLRIYSECTFSEIAEIMQVPVTTAKSRFKYGIEKLRENLALDNFLTF